MKISILIPSRNEPYLTKTVDDVLSKASGSHDVEVVVALEAAWPENWDQVVARHGNKVYTIFHGQAKGMRPSINDCANSAIARGSTHLLKLDAHCMFSPGFDDVLLKDIDDETIVVPRRYGLNVEGWYMEGEAVDYHRLTCPFGNPEDPNDSSKGLHGVRWRRRTEERADITFDEEMSSQGSCYFLTRKMWERLGGLSTEGYGQFASEFQQVGLTAWLSGCRVMIQKGCAYGHWFKRAGRGYSMSRTEVNNGGLYSTWFWMTDQSFPGRVHGLKWLIEHFGGAKKCGWPEDLDEVFARARRVLTAPAIL